MTQARIQDRIQWGLNVAARVAGDFADAYRPKGISDPLAAENRFLRLPALFSGMRGQFQRPNAYGEPLCHGIFDAAYTRVGDYLLQDGVRWFIASQEPLLPVQCVRTNRIVTFSRAAAPTMTGMNGYGGVTATNPTALLTNWPASVLAASGRMQPAAGLPADSTVPFWTVLLPSLTGTVLLPGDLMRDDLLRSGVVTAAELSGLGWRLTVRQAAN
jgi:hypothetical protein